MKVHPLRKYRRKQGLTQGQLGEKLGVSRQMVGLIESGDRRVPAELASDWESITGIPRQEFRPDIFGRPA